MIYSFIMSIFHKLDKYRETPKSHDQSKVMDGVKEDDDACCICCICLDKMNKMNASSSSLFQCHQCEQFIHSICIKPWYDVKHKIGRIVTCPLCRFPIPNSNPPSFFEIMEFYFIKYKPEIRTFLLAFFIRILISLFLHKVRSYFSAHPINSKVSIVSIVSLLSQNLSREYGLLYEMYPTSPNIYSNIYSNLPQFYKQFELNCALINMTNMTNMTNIITNISSLSFLNCGMIWSKTN
jgi:hypothetical protein